MSSLDHAALTSPTIAATCSQAFAVSALGAPKKMRISVFAIPLMIATCAVCEDVVHAEAGVAANDAMLDAMQDAVRPPRAMTRRSPQACLPICP